MPLISGGLVVVAPEETPAVPTVAYRETVGIPSFTWIDPDGTTWPLSNTSETVGWFTLRGPAGWGAAPIEFATDSLPRGGESVRFIQSKPSTIQWPLEIFGNNHDQFVRRYRRISRAFTLTTRRNRPGKLRVQRPDGDVREIEAFYADGLGGENEQNHLYARPVISLYCPEGKWRSTAPIVAARSFSADEGGVPEVNFYSPFISISSSQVVGSGPSTDPENPGDDASLTTVDNPGDVDAWPTWTITGPMSELRAWNVTLQTRFALTYDLGVAETITITTDRPSVRGPDGENLSKHIDWFNPAGTELWPLTDGANVIGLEVDDAGVGTSVRMAFTPRFDNS